MTTWTQIDSLDAPTAGVFDFASLTLTGYILLEVIIAGVTVTTDGTDIKLTFYVSGSEITSGYRWGTRSYASGGTAAETGSTSAAGIFLVSTAAGHDVGNDTNEGFGAIVTVDAPTSTALHKKAHSESAFTDGTGAQRATVVSGNMENAGAITGLKISGTSNLIAGRVRILGLA